MENYNRCLESNPAVPQGLIANLLLEGGDSSSSEGATIVDEWANDNGSPQWISNLSSDIYSFLNDHLSIPFEILKEKWKDETGHLSSITDIAMHPSYQQIIGLGQSVVYLILSEMEKEPDHWFWALQSITGEDPVSPEHRGQIGEMTEAWLRWGRESGYLNESSENHTTIP